MPAMVRFQGYRASVLSAILRIALFAFGGALAILTTSSPPASAAPLDTHSCGWVFRLSGDQVNGFLEIIRFRQERIAAEAVRLVH